MHLFIHQPQDPTSPYSPIQPKILKSTSSNFTSPAPILDLIYIAQNQWILILTHLNHRFQSAALEASALGMDANTLISRFELVHIEERMAQVRLNDAIVSLERIMALSMGDEETPSRDGLGRVPSGNIRASPDVRPQQRQQHIDAAIHRRRMSELRGEIDNIIHELDVVQEEAQEKNSARPTRQRPRMASNGAHHQRRNTREADTYLTLPPQMQLYAPPRTRTSTSTSRKRPMSAHTVISSARTGNIINRPSTAVRRATVAGPGEVYSQSVARPSRPSSARPALGSRSMYRSSSDYGMSPLRERQSTHHRGKRKNSFAQETVKAAQKVYGSTKMLENILVTKKRSTSKRPSSAQPRKRPNSAARGTSTKRNGSTSRSRTSRVQQNAEEAVRTAWLELFESEMERTKMLFPVQAELMADIAHTHTSGRPQSASHHRYHQRELSPDNLLDTLSNRMDAMQREYAISDQDEEQEMEPQSHQSLFLYVHIIGGKNLPSQRGALIKLIVQPAIPRTSFHTFCTQFNPDSTAPFWGEVFGAECAPDDYLVATIVSAEGTFVDEVSVIVKSLEYDVQQEFALDSDADDACLILMFSRTNNIPVLPPSQNDEGVSKLRVVRGLPSEESPHKRAQLQENAASAATTAAVDDESTDEFAVHSASVEKPIREKESPIPPLAITNSPAEEHTPTSDIPDTPQVASIFPTPIAKNLSHDSEHTPMQSDTADEKDVEDVHAAESEVSNGVAASELPIHKESHDTTSKVAEETDDNLTQGDNDSEVHLTMDNAPPPNSARYHLNMSMENDSLHDGDDQIRTMDDLSHQEDDEFKVHDCDIFGDDNLSDLSADTLGMAEDEEDEAFFE